MISFSDIYIYSTHSAIYIYIVNFYKNVKKNVKHRMESLLRQYYDEKHARKCIMCMNRFLE